MPNHDSQPSPPTLLRGEALELFKAHRDRTPFDIEFPIRHARIGDIRWQRIVDAPRELPTGAHVWDGAAHLNFEMSGVVCTIDVPLR